MDQKELNKKIIYWLSRIPGGPTSWELLRLKFLSGITDFQPIKTRNLLYHITPMGSYQWNVSEIKKRIKIFNGIKVAAIATGPGLDPPSTVKKLVPEFDHFIEMPNDPLIRETITFAPLLHYIDNFSETEATFYGHTKGVTKPADRAIRLWTEAMYFHNLDRYEVCMDLLKRHCCAGAFRSYGKFNHFPAESNWHYSGTFFWFRNDTFFTKPWGETDRPWSDITQTRYGVEAHLSLLFGREQAACVFGEDVKSLYNLPYCQKLVGSYKKPAVQQNGGLVKPLVVSREKLRRHATRKIGRPK